MEIIELNLFKKSFCSNIDSKIIKLIIELLIFIRWCYLVSSISPIQLIWLILEDISVQMWFILKLLTIWNNHYKLSRGETNLVSLLQRMFSYISRLNQFSLLFLPYLYQDSTLSLPLTFVSLVNFQTANKMMSSPSGLAGDTFLKKLYYWRLAYYLSKGGASWCNG